VISISAKEDRAILLQQVIYETIPLAKAMQLRVVKLGTNSIRIEAPVADANINIHSTAFAGSIYSICALSAWGFMYHRLQLEKISADVVIAEARIRYLLPVKECIRASCTIDEQPYQDFQKRLLDKGKARLAVAVNVRENDQLQASLDASVAVKITSS
jgi:thioesterase domain-containing protein